MRVCKNLIKAKKSGQEEQKARIRQLEKEVQHLYEDLRELHQRVVQLEIRQKVGF